MTAPERPQGLQTAPTNALRLSAKALESPELLTELLAALGAELPPEKDRARLGLTQSAIDALESACAQGAELAARGKMSGPGTVRVHMGADEAPVMVEVHAESGGGSAQNTSPAALAKYLEERAARAKAGAKKVVVEVPKPAAPAEPTRAPAAIAASRRLLASRVAPTEPAPGAARASQMPTPAVPLPAAAHSRLAEGASDSKDAPAGPPPAPTGKKSKPKDE